MTISWTVEPHKQYRKIIYFSWDERHRYNQMIKIGEFSEVGTFHTWNSDVLLAVF